MFTQTWSYQGNTCYDRVLIFTYFDFVFCIQQYVNELNFIWTELNYSKDLRVVNMLLTENLAIC